MNSFKILAHCLLLCGCACMTQSLSLANSTVVTVSLAKVSNPAFRDPYAFFSFVVPYETHQSCDIYGPICQTGSITVAVSAGNATSTTTTLCSSYLSSQSAWLKAHNPHDGENFPFNWPESWLINFGRSPECTSYAEVWQNRGQYTFSGCGTNDAVVPASEGILLPSQIPPGVINIIPFGSFECCGNCSLDVPEVRLYYFPDAEDSDYCTSKNVSSSLGNHTTTAIEQRAPAGLGRLSTTVLSGYTFTSPSLYLEIVGKVTLSDQCGPLGPTLTDPFVAIPPGQLSTYSVPTQLLPSGPNGISYTDINGIIGGMFVGIVKPLRVADLACPTFGLGVGTSANGDTYTTIGPPYFPIIVPPKELFAMDPEWKSRCSDFLSFAPGLKSFAIFDPPRTLTPALQLHPDPTVAPSPTGTLSTSTEDPKVPSSIRPGQIPAADTPKPTVDPDPTPLAVGLPSNVVPAIFGDPLGHNPSKTKSSLRSSDMDTKISPDNSPIGEESPAAGQHSGGPNPGGAADSGTKHTSQDLGQLIIGALSGGPLAPTMPSLSRPDVWATLAFGSELATVGRSGVKAAGLTAAPGGAAITISGDELSLDPAGIFYVNGNAVPLSQSQSTLPSSVFEVGGQKFTADPTGFSLAGSFVSPGQPPITVMGTPVALVEPGRLMIGASTFQFPAAMTPGPQAYRVGDQPLSIGPSGVYIAGSSIVRGGSPVTISGAVYSLDPSGTLIAGTSRISLPLNNVESLYVGSSHNKLTPDGQGYQITLTEDGLVFAPVSSGLVVSGNTLTPGGSPATINGIEVSLGEDGDLIVGSRTITNPGPSASRGFSNDQDHQPSFTEDGLVFTPVSSGLMVSGSTVSPGGPPATINGIAVNLGENGDLVVGSHTFTDPSHSTSNEEGHQPSFTEGGLVFESIPSGLVVNGTKLIPGGPAATINGTLVSVGPGGGLAVGSHTFSGPSSVRNTGITSQLSAFTGGQVPGYKTDRLSLWSHLLSLAVIMNIW